MQYDLLIVGQGLAGSSLAMRALEHGLQFMIADSNKSGSASVVAAGLFNPITGQRFSKTWMYDELYEAMIPFYRSFEQLLQCQLLFQKKIVRPLFTVEEQNYIYSKTADKAYLNLLELNTSPDVHIHGLKMHTATILKGGFVKVPALILQFRQWLEHQAMLLKEEVQIGSNCYYENGSWHYGGLQFKALCLANGVFNIGVETDHYITPTKGEILVGEYTMEHDYILNNNGFIIPYSNNEIWCGATYERTYDYSPTLKARQELIEKAGKFIDVSKVEWLQHLAGLRPASPNRRPIYGHSKQLPATFYLNGLGSKGVTLAPYFSSKIIALVLQYLQSRSR